MHYIEVMFYGKNYHKISNSVIKIKEEDKLKRPVHTINGNYYQLKIVV